MDLRIQKTLKNINDAYLELAQKKAINKITVKELCDTAMINKATFYAHYQNIDCLVEKFEKQLADNMTDDERLVHLLVEDPEHFLLLNFKIYEENPLALKLLQSQYKEDFLEKLYERLQTNVFLLYPNLREVNGFDITLHFAVYGVIGVICKMFYNPVDKKLIAKRLGNALSCILTDSL